MLPASTKTNPCEISVVQKLRSFVFCALILECLSVSLYAASGDLDQDFGIGGKVQTNLGGANSATAVGIQSDGNIILAGSNGTKFALIRYNTDGSLDQSFGSGGQVLTSFAVFSVAFALAI